MNDIGTVEQAVYINGDPFNPVILASELNKYGYGVMINYGSIRDEHNDEYKPDYIYVIN